MAPSEGSYGVPPIHDSFEPWLYRSSILIRKPGEDLIKNRSHHFSWGLLINSVQLYYLILCGLHFSYVSELKSMKWRCCLDLPIYFNPLVELENLNFSSAGGGDFWNIERTRVQTLSRHGSKFISKIRSRHIYCVRFWAQKNSNVKRENNECMKMVRQFCGIRCSFKSNDAT